MKHSTQQAENGHHGRKDKTAQDRPLAESEDLDQRGRDVDERVAHVGPGDGKQDQPNDRHGRHQPCHQAAHKSKAFRHSLFVRIGNHIAHNQGRSEQEQLPQRKHTDDEGALVKGLRPCRSPRRWPRQPPRSDLI